MKFKAGDEFYYYGNDESKHGSLGKVREVHSPFPPREYACIVNGIRDILYLNAEKMEKVHREPNWEV
jgi:hypothetical protein